jgi:hypothetical protein
MRDEFVLENTISVALNLTLFVHFPCMAQWALVSKYLTEARSVAARMSIGHIRSGNYLALGKFSFSAVVYSKPLQICPHILFHA